MFRRASYMLLVAFIAVVMTATFLVANHVITLGVAAIICWAIFVLTTILWLVARARQRRKPTVTEVSAGKRAIARIIGLFALSGAYGAIRALREGWTTGDTIGMSVCGGLILLFTVMYFRRGNQHES